MARVPRVYESVDGSSEVRSEDVWKTRLEATLRRAERLASLYKDARQGGNPQWARNYYKHARREAREASKMIGVLEIEFGAGMAHEIERTRTVFSEVSQSPESQ